MKKIMILLLLFVGMAPFSVQAHTTLTSSNPAEGEVLAVQPDQIELIFGTVIEEGSSMTLEGPETPVEIENITISDNVMAGTISEELPNGQYIIVWKIIGADGHPIEGQIPFGVDAEVPAEEAADEEAPEEEIIEEEPVAQEENEAAENTESEGENSNVWITVLIAAAIILLAVGMAKLLKNKR